MVERGAPADLEVVRQEDDLVEPGRGRRQAVGDFDNSNERIAPAEAVLCNVVLCRGPVGGGRSQLFFQRRSSGLKITVSLVRFRSVREDFFGRWAARGLLLEDGRAAEDGFFSRRLSLRGGFSGRSLLAQLSTTLLGIGWNLSFPGCWHPIRLVEGSRNQSASGFPAKEALLGSASFLILGGSKNRRLQLRNDLRIVGG
jgi:hypothetical protein